jgi:hypothetical protein
VDERVEYFLESEQLEDFEVDSDLFLFEGIIFESLKVLFKEVLEEYNG